MAYASELALDLDGRSDVGPFFAVGLASAHAGEVELAFWRVWRVGTLLRS